MSFAKGLLLPYSTMATTAAAVVASSGNTFLPQLKYGFPQADSREARSPASSCIRSA
jgi:hypothetical protein